jgi:hypothetical protein
VQWVHKLIFRSRYMEMSNRSNHDSLIVPGGVYARDSDSRSKQIDACLFCLTYNMLSLTKEGNQSVLMALLYSSFMRLCPPSGLWEEQATTKFM